MQVRCNYGKFGPNYSLVCAEGRSFMHEASACAACDAKCRGDGDVLEWGVSPGWTRRWVDRSSVAGSPSFEELGHWLQTMAAGDASGRGFWLFITLHTAIQYMALAHHVKLYRFTVMRISA